MSSTPRTRGGWPENAAAAAAAGVAAAPIMTAAMPVATLARKAVRTPILFLPPRSCERRDEDFPGKGSDTRHEPGKKPAPSGSAGLTVPVGHVRNQGRLGVVLRHLLIRGGAGLGIGVPRVHCSGRRSGSCSR